MKNAEDHTFDDEKKGTQPEETSLVSNADQDQNQDLDLDELYSMLEESPSLENDQTELEMSTESEPLSAEQVSDDSSVLDELQAMYSDLDLSDEEQGSVPESGSTGVSVMEELEAMYGSFSESTTNDEKAAQNDHEAAGDNVSALAELEALLGESAESANDAESSEALSNSSYEHLFENKDSVLDELQNLLQKSIEELDDSADDHFIDAKYPSRNELKTLLEDKLSQLMMTSDGSTSSAFDGSSSILDELNALMKETGSDTNSSALSGGLLDDEEDGVSDDDIDAYISSLSSSDEDAPDDDAASSVLDEFESLLSGTTETVESEVAPDVLPASTVGEKSDSSLDVLEQLEEMLAETTEPENAESSDDINIKAVESDLVIDQELPYLSSENKEQIPNEINVEEVSKFKEKERASEVHKNRLIQQALRKEAYLSDEIENKKLLPLWGVLLVAVVVVGVLVFWNMFDQGNEQDKLVKSKAAATPQALLEEKVLSEISAKDNVNETLASLQTLKPEQEYSSDTELSSIAEQSYVDEASSNDEIVSSIEIEPPVEPMEPVISKSSVEPVVEDAKAKAQKIWSVHLMSYYNQPPQASELEFLNVAGIAYKVEQVVIDGEDWYRVLVNKPLEYLAAKEYAETLKKTLGIKGIWISKSQNVDD